MFMIHTTDDGRIPGFEYLPASAFTPKVGMALMMTNGKLAVAGAANKPVYISMTERDAVCTAGELIPVIRVQPDIIFETTFSAAASSVKPGNKVTMTADGMQVTATTEGGVAEIVEMHGIAAGDKVRVRFA